LPEALEGATMSADPNLYRVLQVDPSAEPEVIEAAYRRLALKYHPDRNLGDAQAEEQMKRINEAFRVLGKPDLRAHYDSHTVSRLPELEITPAEISLRSVDPNARELNFTVHLRQSSGHSFDPAIHRIDLSLEPPWDQADVHWHWSRQRLPADVQFTLAFADGFFEAGRTFSGDIQVNVTAVDRR
jgi:curved DNA-binding protein CbpA